VTWQGPSTGSGRTGVPIILSLSKDKLSPNGVGGLLRFIANQEGS
jgi:hypothetical protein